MNTQCRCTSRILAAQAGGRGRPEGTGHLHVVIRQAQQGVTTRTRVPRSPSRLLHTALTIPPTLTPAKAKSQSLPS